LSRSGCPGQPFFAREIRYRLRHSQRPGGTGWPREKHIFRKLGYLAGTEAERAEDLIHAITNPDVSAIISIRGGFGSSRLLPWLPFSILQKYPKIFVGYSDTTCLHLALLAKTRWITFMAKPDRPGGFSRKRNQCGERAFRP